MKRRQLFAGTVLNYAVIILQMLSTVIITPFIIHSLGDGTYGVYKIVTSIIAYMGILNFGFGNAAIRFLVDIRTKNDLNREKEFLSVIKMLNLAAIAIALVVGVILYFIIPGVFAESLTAQEIEIARQMFVVLIGSVIVNILNDIYSAVVTAGERFIFLKGVDLLRYLLRIVLIISLLSMRPSAVALVSIDFIMSVFVLVCNSLYCSRKLHVRPKYSLKTLCSAEKEYYKPVITYALFFFLNLIADQLLWNTDSIIIGMRLSSLDAAVYGSGATISAGFYSLSFVIGILMFPQVVRLVSGGASKQELTDITIRIGRAQTFVTMFVLTAYFACGQQFISLWIGPHYSLAWTTSILVMVGSLFISLISVGHLILRAMNRQTHYLSVYIIMFLINAVLTYIIVVKYGIVGAACATLFSFVVGTVFLIAPYLHRIIGINMFQFAKGTVPIIGVSSALGLACFFLFRFIVLDSWIKLAAGIIIYIIAYGAVLIVFLFNKGEKEWVGKIMRKILRRTA